jgi:hypothetical protein
MDEQLSIAIFHQPKQPTSIIQKHIKRKDIEQSARSMVQSLPSQPSMIRWQSFGISRVFSMPTQRPYRVHAHYKTRCAINELRDYGFLAAVASLPHLPDQHSLKRFGKKYRLIYRYLIFV